MSLAAVSDSYLAARTAQGDETALAELARRYRPLLVHAAQGPPPGVEVEDLRQVGLLALLATCRQYDRARGPFAALASWKVRHAVARARRAARAHKHRLLSEALGATDNLWGAGSVPASEGSDPARVVELRDELRERAERAERARRPRPDRRSGPDAQITRALGLIAEGYSITQAAFAVGASRERVARWLARSGLPRPRPRGHTPEQVRTALALVRAGASQRAAAAAVGASKSALQYWLKTETPHDRDAA